MPTNAEKEPMPPPPLALSLKDLELKPNDDKLQQAISCIRIYQAQAIRLAREQQEEMCDIIKSHDYVRARTAKIASAHKLYGRTMNALKKKGKRVENLSWPIYLILSAVYKKLPKRYIKLVRRLYGTSFIGDYSNTYRTLLRGSDSASSVSANAPNVSQNPFTFSSSTKPFALSKDAPTGSTPFAAPAGSTLFSSSKNAPPASTNLSSSSTNAFSGSTNSFNNSDPVVAATQKTIAEAKACMARKAMEDQRISGPAPRDDEQDLTGEEDSDSSYTEVEVLWHKKRQASPVNREDDLSVAAKRPRPSSSGKPFDITTPFSV
ncbi:hypothetical protein CI102_9457 [Trichoderma harzianum]|nr:hypothetical protein CI102_9457 [Trichoderma harzianum]